ncbi:MAG: glycosyltransferase family 4 protein [Syntrophomonadaceae bacterium]|jgi:UDP-GlcNAc:undecaprenyl-phosphate GlcNAc-1-phosphate transferase
MAFYVGIAVLLSAFVLSYLTVPYAIKLALKIGAVDNPNKRKVHTCTVPRIGGMAIFLSLFICLVFILKVSGPFLGLIYGACLIFFVGLLDDIYQLSARIKLFGQIAAAVLAVHFGVVVHFVTNPFNGAFDLGFLSIPLTILWIVGISNAINLIDGLDGLAAGVSAIAASTMGVIFLLKGQPEVALVAFTVVAAIIGFLPFNFYPAKTFMGDSGSNLLGFVLACLAIIGTAKSAAFISLFIPIVILAIPITDTFFAIIRRMHNKTPIFLPDRDHLHHRLMALGMSHRRSVLIIYSISSFFSIVAITITFISSSKATVMLALLLLLVVLAANKIGLLSGEKRKSDTYVKGQPQKVEL